eukprot:COSAG01_NODE_65245_length_274_cov_0.422857_1_plen_65_part_10
MPVLPLGVAAVVEEAAAEEAAVAADECVVKLSRPVTHEYTGVTRRLGANIPGIIVPSMCGSLVTV